MKRIKRAAMMAMAAAMLAGCSSTTQESASGTDDGASQTEEAVKIGVIQYAEHPALDQATKGFEDYLKENGYENAEIDYKNAQNDQSNCTTIAQTFVNDRDDLIYAVATPAALAVANETKDIPIVVSAVTDLKSAGLVEDNEKPGTNVTGASDLNPVDGQLALLKQLLPDAKKIAIMFTNSEVNSRYQADLAEAECEKIGLEYVEATVTDSNQIQQVTESLIGKVDAIYIPTDNLLAEGMASVTQVANENNLPCIVGEEGMVSNGGLATYGIDYYELGKLAGAQAVAILKNGDKPQDMAVEYLPTEKLTLCVNAKTAKQLGIEIPAEILDKATVVGEAD